MAARRSSARAAEAHALVGYLAMPIDLIPDFIPVAGQLEDAILVPLVLRSAGPGLVCEHWPGLASMGVMLHLAGASPTSPS